MPIVMDVLALDYESLTHFTPTTKQRKVLAKSGVAMPDGSFYIRNQSELSDAIRAVGRATPNASESDTARRNSVRRHIIGRAASLKLSNMIPDTWNSDGSLKQYALDEEFIAHFGRKGMKWGQHVFGDRGGSSSSGHVHPDAAKASASLAVARKHGSSALSSHDLRNLNTRLQLERQYTQLSDVHKSEGRKFIEQVAKEQLKQSVAEVVRRHGPAGAAWVAKNVGRAVVNTGRHVAA